MTLPTVALILDALSAAAARLAYATQHSPATSRVYRAEADAFADAARLVRECAEGGRQ